MLLSLADKKSVLVILDEEDIKVCRERAERFCKYKLWGDKASEDAKQWRKGVLNDDDDPSQAERIGCYGEMAFSFLTGIPVDDEVKAKGNRHDFCLGEKPIEVKTHKFVYRNKAKELNLYGPFFIKAVSEKGKELNLNSDYYVVTSIADHNGKYIKNGFRTEKDATHLVVEIHGVISKEAILANKDERLADAINGKHKNYYIKEEELQDVITFVWEHRGSINPEKADLFIR